MASAGQSGTPQLWVAVSASRAVWQAFGPLDPVKPRAVTVWAALDGRRPAESVAQIALAHGVNPEALTRWIGQVGRFSRDHVRLDDALRNECTRPTTSGEDHQRRVRVARLLAQPRPTRTAGVPVTPEFRPAEQGLLRAAADVLAAAGPLPLIQLTKALTSRVKPYRAKAWDPADRGEVTEPEVAEFVRALTVRAGLVHLDSEQQLVLARPWPAPPPGLRW